MKPATIYDVARRAGVSHQTVTRFLRGYEGMRPETRQRVAEALSALEYRPNSAARQLRSRQINRIAILADRMDSNGPARILDAAGTLARRRGYVLDIVIADGDSPGAVADSLAIIMEHQVAGILATAQTQVVIEELRRQELRIPLVVGPELGMTPGLPSTNELAGAMAAQHLLDLGHRRIGYVAGPDAWLAAEGRERGFVQRVSEAGGVVPWRSSGDWSPASGYRAWQAMASEGRDVTAVGVANDGMAIGFIAAAADDGTDIPSQMSVIGTDDVPEARYLRPSLTTVRMDFEDEGHHLMLALLSKIEGTEAAAHERLADPVLVTRGSTQAS